MGGPCEHGLGHPEGTWVREKPLGSCHSCLFPEIQWWAPYFRFSTSDSSPHKHSPLLQAFLESLILPRAPHLAAMGLRGMREAESFGMLWEAFLGVRRRQRCGGEDVLPACLSSSSPGQDTSLHGFEGSR